MGRGCQNNHLLQHLQFAERDPGRRHQWMQSRDAIIPGTSAPGCMANQCNYGDEYKLYDRSQVRFPISQCRPKRATCHQLRKASGSDRANPMQSTVLQSVPHWPLVKLVCCITCHQSQPSMAPSHNSGLMNCFSNSMNPQQYDQGKYTHHIMSIMNSMKLVIPLHFIS